MGDEMLLCTQRDRLTRKPTTSTSFEKKTDKKSHNGRISRRLNKVTAILIIVAIVGISLLLFRSHLPSADGSPAGAVGTPATAHVQAGGLEFFMHIIPEPYFLSELFAADLSLTNHTRTTFTLAGPSGAGSCGSALFLAMTGDVATDYTLPVSDSHPCPFMQTQLRPEETLTFHHFIPLLSSGDITLSPGAQFLHTQVDPNGGQSITAGKSPLDGHWPSITILVASQVPISTTILHEPNCGDYGNQNIHWSYAVSAPGYAIVSGQHHGG